MKHFFTILITLTSLVGFSQNTWTTQITANNSSESAFKLIKTQDGGFVTVLNRVDTIMNTPQNIIYNKIAIVKLDVNGDTVFYKKIKLQDSTFHYINDFIELPSGDMLLNGFITTITSNDTTGGTLLIKTNFSGDTLWTKVTNNNLGTGYAHYNLIGLTNKFWTIDGIHYGGQFDTQYVFIHEYDYNGNLLNINYADTFFHYPYATPRLFHDINDTVLVHAQWKNGGAFLKKIDTTFNKFYNNNTQISKIPSVSIDGTIGFLGNQDLWETTSQMDSIWYHPFAEYEINWGAGTSQTNTNICPTSDGGYAFIGDTWNAINNNIFLIKTDALGNEQFSEMYWSVTTHNIDVVQANDGGYVMMNTGTGYWNANGEGIWIVKTDQYGVIGIDENYVISNTKIYPNPAHNYFTISTEKNTTTHYTIYSLLGKIIETGQFVKTKRINTSQLSGIYFVELLQEGKRTVEKVIINN